MCVDEITMWWTGRLKIAEKREVNLQSDGSAFIDRFVIAFQWRPISNVSKQCEKERQRFATIGLGDADHISSWENDRRQFFVFTSETAIETNRSRITSSHLCEEFYPRWCIGTEFGWARGQRLLTSWKSLTPSQYAFTSKRDKTSVRIWPKETFPRYLRQSCWWFSKRRYRSSFKGVDGKSSRDWCWSFSTNDIRREIEMKIKQINSVRRVRLA